MLGCSKEKQTRKIRHKFTIDFQLPVSEAWQKTLKGKRNSDAIHILMLLYDFLMFFRLCIC